MKKQIVITGSSWEMGSDYTKTTGLNDEMLEYIRPMIDLIIANKDKYNWTWDTELVFSMGRWVTMHKYIKMYNTYVNSYIINSFARMVPRNIDKITSIKVQKIEEEVLL